MCDQYYAVYQPPGGGLCVLSNPFGPEPAVRDVLADAVVQRGRLSGTKLDGGSFLSPDLSYDAQQMPSPTPNAKANAATIITPIRRGAIGMQDAATTFSK